MRSRTTRSFWDGFAALPEPVQRQARQAFRRWRQNPAPSRSGIQARPTPEPIYSVRIGRGYRALGLGERDLMTWFWVGSHVDYDAILRKS